ncbi:4'-phosphopantetheinyl transferase superfamily protein [Pseudoduganella lurida]|uniref:4'-phosphopantetheinyl transferase superfamily protein n=1 Tax=Pseudoduganella lurida TaxID=1036180 RepID=A0A562QZD4_9BURK|nr:polyketide synthase dehydratase domain-containing protein [Pseudoduganella lurida]TWI62181.1 4'-phosphopantetheinyl transferase superfamily protein [Pseudoduganella lurida]
MDTASTMPARSAAPLVARLQEMRDLRTQDAAPATPPSPPSAPLLPAAAGLPFLGTVTGYQPGVQVAVERPLLPARDRYLSDHDFVQAPGMRNPNCYPVVPMTMSLEMMAEVAACLVPGLGVTGIEDVNAVRWIVAGDGGAAVLRVEAVIDLSSSTPDRYRIDARICADGDRQPSISARLLFGRRYPVAPPPLPPAEPPAGAAAPVLFDTASAYAQRLMFHGPSFQAMHGIARLGAEDVRGELVVRAPSTLFAGTEAPQLLLDPALLDGLGQLVALWSFHHHRQAAFPVGLGRLTLCGPTPPAGSVVPARAVIRGRQLKMLVADLEVGDGRGGTWLRIDGWRAWQFAWDARLLAFQRDPVRQLLSDAQDLPVPAAASSPSAAVQCRRIGAARVARFDAALLARHYLQPAELARFQALPAAPRRTAWLLGRVAAKDAARAWHLAQGGMALHPGDFAIDNDAHGQPHVTHWPDSPAPHLSIAHCGEEAVALAGATPVGIDLETVAVRDEACEQAVTTAAERELLGVRDGAVRAAWLTRLWCAKEAMGKRMGSGVVPGPRHFEAQALCADGSLRMWHAASGTGSIVTTLRSGEYMLAFDLGPRGAAAVRETKFGETKYGETKFRETKLGETKTKEPPCKESP